MEFDEVQAFCLTFPGAKVDIKWDDHICICVAGKMFAILTLGEDGGVRLCLKTTPDLFEVLTAHDGIEPAAYIGRYHWVMFTRLDALEPAQVRDLIAASYQLIFKKLSKKIQRAVTGSA